MTEFTDWLEIHVDDSGAMNTCSTRTQIFTTTTVSTRLAREHNISILYLFNSLRMISTFIQVYYAMMRYSESVDKSGRWLKMMAMTSVMLGDRTGAHHVLWGVDSGLGRVSTHRLGLDIIG